MTKEEKLDILAMRLDRCTYKEIADKYGVSKQNIQQTVVQMANSINGMYGIRGRSIKAIYPNIKNWLADKGMSACEFADLVQIDRKGIYARLRGRTQFKISEIKEILKATDMTFEEAFEEENQED